MSQRKFKYGVFDITAGWDCPLQYFYLMIKNAILNKYVFNNLNRRNMEMKLSEIEEILDRYDIVPPINFYHDLRQDKINQVGNVVHTYR